LCLACTLCLLLAWPGIAAPEDEDDGVPAGDADVATDGTDGNQAAEDDVPEDEVAGPIVTVTPEGVSVFAVRADAHGLLTEIARQTGFHIIVDDTVKGSLTVNFRNRKVTEIIEDIADTYGFACRAEDGVFTLTEGLPAHVSSYLLSETVSVTPNYIPATDAEQLLPVFLQDYTAPSRSQNAIILSAPPSILEKFRNDIEQFDIPADQIMIEVLMVEFSENEAEEFFVNLGWSGSGREIATDSGLSNVSFRLFGQLPQEFRANLRALEIDGRAHVRANPKIATVSGREASIFIGERRFLAQPVEVAGGGDDDDDYRRRQINFIKAGVNLSIEPWTGGEGEIAAEIDAEISTMSAPDPVTGLPEKQTRQVSTEVRMWDGETVVIGGLVQDELIETRSKIPILGDIPLIGKLFRSKNSRHFRTELVIFVTARILPDSSGAAGAAGEGDDSAADATQ